MAQLTITVTYPDNKQIDLRDTLCSAFNYQDLIDGQPNPQTKAQFLTEKCQEHLSTWIKNTYKIEKDKIALLTSETITIS